MLKFYFNGSPNPTKVALFLEEAALPYEAIPVDTRKGDQFKQAFAAINPNGKVPAIVDGDTTVFDSNAILLYLGEKTGVPSQAGGTASCLWLMFVASGVGPFSGQAVHFKHLATEKVPYAHNRYQFEAQRHYGILNDRRASTNTWSATPTRSSTWTWGWARMVPFIMGDDAWAKLPNVKRLVDESMRGRRPRANGLKDKFKFKAEMDGDAHALDRRQIVGGGDLGGERAFEGGEVGCLCHPLSSRPERACVACTCAEPGSRGRLRRRSQGPG
jgi:GST-like protein